MADPQVNFFKSTLVGTYSDSDTSLTIATGDGALLPDPSTDGAFNLTIFEGLQVTGSTEFEIVRVTARSGDILTVTRGQESTTPLTIGSATHSILMSATKKTFDDINDAIENIDLTSLTGVEELTFDSTGDEEFGLPAGTTAQRPSNPSAGYMRWNSTLSRIEFYNGSRWAGLSEIGFQSETMEVAQLSVTANDAVAENIVLEVEYLVIAGGGAGGAVVGGGGGAGGYRSSVSGESSGGGASAESPAELNTSTNYTVTVGAGGAGGSGESGSNGSDSVFNTITSTGGGGGSSFGATASSGGSGGGAGGAVGSNTGASGTSNQGYAGGSASGSSTVGLRNSGGGGGANEIGSNGTTTICGDGGDGVSSIITGSSVARAGGGGGGADRSAIVTGGNGGIGGGGDGADGSSSAVNGDSATANTGGGGGGGNAATGDGPVGDGGSGGSGVVILRYPSDFSITIGAGLTGSETTDGSEKYAEITAGTGNVSWTTA